MGLELAAGVVIADKLRLERPLGQGGMGVVWAARHLTLDADVAVKLIRPERAAADPALVTRFEREAKATARIAHPHVVQVMDFGAHLGVPYLVIELLEGFSLAELLEDGGRLSVGTAKALVQQMASALEAAHERGVVHRDIKPHNVFILAESATQPLFVKVLDFGVAKMLGDEPALGHSGTLTETGTIVGSPPYMSPEQIEGKKDVDLRSDLWSLGVIVYECLTGRLPFHGNSFVAVGAAVLAGKYRPATELRPGLPRAIDDWFAKALCVDPGGRFQSASEMAQAFIALAEAEHEARPSPFATTVDAAPGIARTDSHAPLAEKPRARSRRRAALFSAAALLVATGVLIVTIPRTGASTACPAGMLRIEGARFTMGSVAEGDTPSNESPAHEVSLQAFCLDVTEVTVGEYERCARCPELTRTARGDEMTPNGITFYSAFCNGPDSEDHPVNCIDWHAAGAYCESLGRRLPTESEWELAARGTDRRLYPWGNMAPSSPRVNACGRECQKALLDRRKLLGYGPEPAALYDDDDGAKTTAPVGSFRAGAAPSGVHDLAGNVWEWTSTPACRYDQPDCGESNRVIRGGGWDTVESRDLGAARRRPSAPSARSWSVGFRCAKSL